MIKLHNVISHFIKPGHGLENQTELHKFIPGGKEKEKDKYLRHLLGIEDNMFSHNFFQLLVESNLSHISLGSSIFTTETAFYLTIKMWKRRHTYSYEEHGTLQCYSTALLHSTIDTTVVRLQGKYINHALARSGSIMEKRPENGEKML